MDESDIDTHGRDISSSDVSLILISARLEARIMVLMWITRISVAINTGFVLHYLFGK